MLAEQLSLVLNETPQSGQVLAAQLGVSRNTIWKTISGLIEQGFPILRSRAGYAWALGAPVAHVLNFRGNFGQPYQYLGNTDSTQSQARQLAEAGSPEGTLVLAETQSQGRGRRGRAWHSPSGSGLYFSLILRPQRPLQQLPLLSLAAGVALREACGVGGLKWPNDVLAPDGRKLAGVLLEADIRGEDVRQLILGIGLNVHRHSALPPEASALADWLPVSRRLVLEQLMLSLERWIYASDADILQAWQQHSYTLGRTVQVNTLHGEVCGLATAITADGALCIQNEQGNHLISTGDVQLLAIQSS